MSDILQDFAQKSTKKTLNTLEIAVSELVGHRQHELTPDFILLALLSQKDAEAVKIIEKLTPHPVDAIAQIKAQILQHMRPPTNIKINQIVGGPELAALFQRAYEEAKEMGDEYISTGSLFIALFDPKIGSTSEYLQHADIHRKQAITALKELRGGRTIDSVEAEAEADVLAKYTRDLTELARKGELDPVIGREEEITQVIQTLSRRKKNNPVLIGEAAQIHT